MWQKNVFLLIVTHRWTFCWTGGVSKLAHDGTRYFWVDVYIYYIHIYIYMYIQLFLLIHIAQIFPETRFPMGFETYFFWCWASLHEKSQQWDVPDIYPPVMKCGNGTSTISKCFSQQTCICFGDFPAFQDGDLGGLRRAPGWNLAAT